MTAALPSSAARWVAAGVRHAVLLRILPALRHDLASPISVLRMSSLLLQRQLAAPTIDAAGCLERVVMLEQQIGSLADGLRSLRGWDLASSSKAIDRQVLVADSLPLLRALFDLRGVTVDVDAASADNAGAMWPDATALRYLLLASLCHLGDSHPLLVAVRIEYVGDDGLRLVATDRSEAVPPPLFDPAPPEPGLTIDAAALQCLAADLGYEVRFEADGVFLPLAAL
ncbi:MAG: hypothetical protein ABIW85_05115 [Variovorax sp.]